MAKPAVAAIRMCAALLLAGLLASPLPPVSVAPCWGSDTPSDDPTFSLTVNGEPLRTVLGRISRATGWQITAPEKWLDKPVTQTLNEVVLEDGLRFVLKSAGIENILVTYDAGRKLATVFDTELQQGRTAQRPEPLAPAPPPVPVIPPAAPTPTISPAEDPMLNRMQKEAGSDSQSERMRRRRPARPVPPPQAQ
jgi:hypothetical protein